MKLLNILFSVICSNSYNIIGLFYPTRPVYVSSQIENDQVIEIEKSIDKMGLLRTYDKTQNHIRVEYCDECYGRTMMDATVMSSGDFLIYFTNVGFYPTLTFNILGCVIMHEFGHALGLMHNADSDSIMNYTLYVDHNSYILNNNTECFLSYDDLSGINYIKES